MAKDMPTMTQMVLCDTCALPTEISDWELDQIAYWERKTHKGISVRCPDCSTLSQPVTL